MKKDMETMRRHGEEWRMTSDGEEWQNNAKEA